MLRYHGDMSPEKRTASGSHVVDSVENRMGGTDARKTERRSQSCIDNNDDDGVDDGIRINFDSTPMKFLVCARIFSSWGGLGGRGGGGGEEEEEIHIAYH